MRDFTLGKKYWFWSPSERVMASGILKEVIPCTDGLLLRIEVKPGTPDSKHGEFLVNDDFVDPIKAKMIERSRRFFLRKKERAEYDSRSFADTARNYQRMLEEMERHL